MFGNHSDGLFGGVGDVHVLKFQPQRRLCG